jgi:hypothetical protein
MEEELYVLGFNGSDVLIVNKADLVKYNQTEPQRVLAVKVNFDIKKIYPPNPFQNFLKFGNWDEPSEDQKRIYLQLLNSKFSDKDILEKIILPLAKANL